MRCGFCLASATSRRRRWRNSTINCSPGRKGIGYIRDWLRQFGYEIANTPAPHPSKSNQRKEKQLSRAVNVLRRNGFDVQVASLLGQIKK